MNLKKLEIIFNACLNDTIEYLVPPVCATASNIFFREDSPGLVSSNESKSSNGWELAEQARRVVQYIDNEINSLSYAKDILTGDDWEDLVGR